MSPVNVYNELRVADKFALRSEINLGLTYGYGANKNHWSTAFGAAVEPRFYYNMNKRIQHGRKIWSPVFFCL
ncbi:MAG: hypothetical protein ACK5IQ_06590 [Bacteroidales bacterium]